MIPAAIGLTVIAVAFILRDVAVRAIEEQMAFRRDQDARKLAGKINALADRVAAAEAALRDATLRGMGR